MRKHKQSSHCLFILEFQSLVIPLPFFPPINLTEVMAGRNYYEPIKTDLSINITERIKECKKPYHVTYLILPNQFG